MDAILKTKNDDLSLLHVVYEYRSVEQSEIEFSNGLKIIHGQIDTSKTVYIKGSPLSVRNSFCSPISVSSIPNLSAECGGSYIIFRNGKENQEARYFVIGYTK